MRNSILMIGLSAGFILTAASGYAGEVADSAGSAVVTPVDAMLETTAADSENVTLDFKEADINTVLRVMSLKSKMNIVAGPEVQGTVTIRLENVPWEKALQVVLRTYGYVYEKDGNIIRVTTRDNLAAEPVVTQTYILNYTEASEIQSSLQDMLTERGRIKIAKRTNMIVITDIPTNLYTIGEVIKKLDKVTPQAFIDSRIIKTDVGAAENIGIEWKTGGTDNNLGSITGSSRPTTFPFSTKGDGEPENTRNFFKQFFATETGTSDAANTVDPRSFPRGSAAVTGDTYSYGTLSFASFNAIMQLLKTRSNTKIVSNPRIVVLNNQAAKVQVGQQIPLATFERNSNTGSVEVSGYTYRDVGVVMNVTPHINSQEEILVDLKPEVSAQNGSLSFGEFSAPIFDVTTAITQVLINSGETIAIGGLLTDNTQIAESKVPYLGDIPIAGKLFRSKRQTEGTSNAKVETLFFVTVTMVDTEGQPTGDRVKKNEPPIKGKARKESVSGKKVASESTSTSAEAKAEKDVQAQ